MNTNLNPSDLSSRKSDFVIAKIVSTPSETSWSQAYNAGNLFAVLSLKKEVQGKEVESESLGAIGKKILDSLEQNFFTIENKNLGSIKQAVTESSKTIPDDIESSLVVCAFVKNVLYLFVNDKGKVFLKRGNNYGTILESNEIDSKSIVSSSGYVQNNDLIILGTKTFFDIVSSQTLVSSLNHKSPAEIAEILTPGIHEKEESRAAAIIIQYEEKEKIEVPFVEEKQGEINHSTSFGKAQDKSSGQKYTFFENLLSSLKKRVKILKPQFNHSKRVFLTIAIVVLIVFISSVFFAIKKQADTKTKVLFNDIYTKAQKSYDEGQSLLELNKSLTRDSLLSAQKVLNENKDKFPVKSKEAVQLQALLKKVESGLTQVSSVDKSGLDRKSLSISVENGSGTEGAAGKAKNILKELGYNVISTGNADNYNYQGVTIKVKKDKGNFLDLLKKDLAKDYAITSTSSDLPSTSPTDALVIIGK